MRRVLSIKEHERMTEELDKVKYRCKCGHRVIITNNREKALCGWCNNYVFKDKREEMKYRVKEKLNG